MIDLDLFKTYNDTFGHPAGDRLLSAAARNWTHILNVSYPTAMLARIGGEEFAVALPDCDAATARTVLTELCGSIGGGQTASAGITQATPTDEPRSLMARADAALYAAKHTGRNRVEVLTSG